MSTEPNTTPTTAPAAEDYQAVGWPITTVPASEVKIGDLLVQAGYVGRVTSIATLDLAWHQGRPIEINTSGGSGRWEVVKIDAPPVGGVVCFPDVPVQVITREAWKAGTR